MPLMQQAQQLAGTLPPLLIAAERVAQNVYQGVHGRRRAGIGESFWQFRRYEAGDAADRIDWRQSARTDKVFVREREWEAVQTACLWADASGSMRYSSKPNLPTKAERAQLLMLALASLCLRGGENVLWLDGESAVLRGKDTLQRLALRLEEQGSSKADPLPQQRLPRHGAMVLCSDFLMPVEALQTRMRDYAAQKMRGVLVHILDPIEESFAFDGRVNVQGCENEMAILLPDAGAVRLAYAAKLAAHKEQLKHIARSAGWLYLSHVTDQGPHLALMQLYGMMADSAAA